MRNRVLMILVAPLVCLLISCDALSFLLQPSNVSVSLVNNSTFDLTVNYFYNDDNNILADILTLPLVNEEGNETIAGGRTFTFSDSCDNLQAIIINDAEIQATVSSPNANSSVLRIDTDFNCGDRIIFTFTPGDVILGFPTSLTITTTVAPSLSLP